MSDQHESNRRFREERLRGEEEFELTWAKSVVTEFALRKLRRHGMPFPLSAEDELPLNRAAARIKDVLEEMAVELMA